MVGSGRSWVCFRPWDVASVGGCSRGEKQHAVVFLWEVSFFFGGVIPLYGLLA